MIVYSMSGCLKSGFLAIDEIMKRTWSGGVLSDIPQVDVKEESLDSKAERVTLCLLHN